MLHLVAKIMAQNPKEFVDHRRSAGPTRTLDMDVAIAD
jgi:hypothetical protein